MHRRASGSSLLFIVALLLGLPPMAVVAQTTAPVVAATDWAVEWEHWYQLEIAGASAGSMRETVERSGSLWRTSRESRFRIARGPIELEVAMSSVFTETNAGQPVELHFVSEMAAQSVDTTWVFDADERVVRTASKQGGRTLEAVLAWPEGDWLTPIAARRFWLERAAAGAETMTFSTVDGENGLAPIELRLERLGAETVEQDGRDIPVTVWRTTSSAMPGLASTSRYTSDGFIVLDEIEAPFGRMVTRLLPKAEVLAGAAGPAPELMLQTFVQVDRPIRDARARRQLELHVRAKAGELPSLPTAGAQRVERRGPGEALVRVDTERPVPAEPGELVDEAFLGASAMVDPTDALIRKLAARALRTAGVDAAADPAVRAETLRRFVLEHISAKALDTGFATASEVARLRTGDCSEHGVLLCALLRADGIPARVATGLVYADSFAGERDIFGWHMWTQALIDGNWIDLDATLPGPYDAAHLLTATTALEEGAGSSDLTSMLMLLGNLEIEVVETAPDAE